MIVMPEFYHAFACLAAACSHSCCRGWEIDVDDTAAARYAAVPGDFGARLCAALETGEDGAHFCLTEEERCPFLQPDGLCEIIRRLGEDALCDVCALHPRFFSAVGEDELWGLGLSCEAACALLTSSADPLRFLAEESGDLLEMPGLLARYGVEAPAEALRFDGAPPSGDYLRRMAQTEPIDDRWAGELSATVRALSERCPALPTGVRYDRMLQHILFRQLERLDRESIRSLTAYARDSAAFVAAQDALFGISDEHLRRWSEQIEYSTENVEILLTFHRVEGVS